MVIKNCLIICIKTMGCPALRNIFVIISRTHAFYMPRHLIVPYYNSEGTVRLRTDHEGPKAE